MTRITKGRSQKENYRYYFPFSFFNLLLISVIFLFAFSFFLHTISAAPEVNTNAINYLKTKPLSAWGTLAFVASGEQNLSGDHLKSAPGMQAISYTAPIMAIAALGENPRTYGSEDFVAKLKSFHLNGQIGDPGTLNDDIFGILALSAAGESSTNSVVQDAKSTILGAQHANGGWGFAANASPDTNMTSMAIMALLEVGHTPTSPEIQKALDFLKNSQNMDGGFPYDPVSPYGTGSDASSDAWVISALYKLGIDPASWKKNGNDPIEHLKTLQTSSGYFAYQSGSPEDSFSPITTAYATIALAGKGYPVARFQMASSDVSVSFRIDGSAATICTGSVAATTALSVVEKAASQCGYTFTISQTSFGPYLSRIGEDAASGLSGWRYRVNNALPSVGAADYPLSQGNFVHWYFGDSDEPRDFGASVDLRARVISAGGGGVGGGNTVSFTVEPDELDFGDLRRGDSSTKTLTVTNTGTTGITVEALVTGDDLFTRNLKINNAAWEAYAKNMARQETDSVDASLTVPSNAASGDANGRLIFWAIAQ